jgi:hypothetical protein
MMIADNGLLPLAVLHWAAAAPEFSTDRPAGVATNCDRRQRVARKFSGLFGLQFGYRARH